jgi:hypothetical protein
MGRGGRKTLARRLAVAAGAAAMTAAVMLPLEAQQGPAACRVAGRAASGAAPLPGVAIVVRSGETVKAVTSSDPDGTYHVTLPAGAYRLTAELTGFVRVEPRRAAAPRPPPHLRP